MATSGGRDSPSLCFFCDENPREEGDFMCRSCKEDHPMCYECGQRRRNFPFKLCKQCYKEQRQGNSIPSAKPSIIKVSSQDPDGVSVGTVMDSLNGLKIADATAIQTQEERPKILCQLNNDQNTYKEIAKHFKKEWAKLTSSVKTPPVPLAIFAIQNEELTKKYRQYVGTELRRQTGRSSNSELFFHGTKLLCDLVTTQSCCDDENCAVCGISLRGFDEKRIGTNIPRFMRFGKGIYLAPNSSKCHDYTQGNPSYGFRAQLLCLVAQGAKCELLQDNTKLTEAPPGYNSVYGRKGGSLNYDEIVVYDSGAVWPQYIVVYELNGVDKIAK